MITLCLKIWLRLDKENTSYLKIDFKSYWFPINSLKYADQNEILVIYLRNLFGLVGSGYITVEHT